MPLDMVDQIRIDRIEKRLSAVTVSMITVQAMVLGLADDIGQMDAQAAEGVRAAIEAWGEVLSDSEVSELKPVVEAMDTLLRKHGVGPTTKTPPPPSPPPIRVVKDGGNLQGPK